MSRWLPAIAVLVVTGLVAWQTGARGAAASLVIGLTGLAIAWWVSPLYGRSGPTHRDVTSDPDHHPVVIYWRPGCIYCVRLNGALGKRTKEATWVNIWSDAEAAAHVRSVNDGNETVPTVVIDGQPHTNPDPQVVREALERAR